MKALTAQTRAIKNSMPLQVKTIPLLTLTLTDAQGKSFPVYISNQPHRHSNHTWLPYISTQYNIEGSLPAFAGLAYQWTLRVSLPQATGNPNKKLSDLLQPYVTKSCRFALVLPPSTEEIVVFSGDITNFNITLRHVQITAISNSLADMPITPTPRLTLAEYPNLSLSGLDKVSPLVFGSLNDSHRDIVAPSVGLSILTKTHLATSRGKTYGNVFYFDNNKLYAHPSVTKKNDGTFVLSTPVSQTLNRNITYDAETVYLTSTEQSWHYYDSPNEKISSVRDISVQLNFNSVRGQCYVTVELWVFGVKRHSKNQVIITTDNYDDVDFTLRYSGNISGGGEIMLRLKAYGTTKAALYGPSIEFTYTYRTRVPTIPSGATYFQAIPAGYKDAAANYPDGPAVNTENGALTHPIDIIHALFRDQKYGAGMESARLDRTNIASLRSGRFDFSLTQALTSQGLDRFAHDARLYAILGPGGKWSFLKRDTPIVAVFGVSNTLDIRSKQEIKQIKNQFFIQYGYSHTLNRYTKHIIRSPDLRGSGSGSLAANGTFTAQSAIPSTPSLVDRMLFNSHYYRVTAAISASSWKVKREDGGTLAAGTGEFYIGVGFDYACYLSAQAYGPKPYMDQESTPYDTKYIQDDDTARALADALVAFYSQNKTVAAIDTTATAIDIDLGDNIALMDYTEKVGVVTANTDAYNTAIPYTPEPDMNISAGDVLIMSNFLHPYFEVVSAQSGGSTFLRGQLNSIPRRWPSQTGIYRPTHKFLVENMRVHRNRITLTGRARTSQ